MTDSPPSARVVITRHRRLFVAGVALPATIALIGLIMQAMALPHLPDPIAVHWSGSTPDGSASAWVLMLVTASFGIGFPLLGAALSWPGLRRDVVGVGQRLLAATFAGTSVMLTALGTAIVVTHRGVDTWQQAPSINAPLVIAVSTGLFVGVAVWWAIPETDSRAGAQDPAPLSLNPHDTVVWLRSTSLSPIVLAAATWATLIVVVLAVILWMLRDTVPATITTVAAIGVVGALAATMFYRVRVDNTGLTIRARAGWPRIQVPYSEMAAIALVQVEPLADFGGWGLRRAPGKLGVITRGGEGIEITQHSGRSVVVTVDDAETGAALLQAQLNRFANTA